MQKIHMFIGSVYGAAEQVAEMVAEALGNLGHSLKLNSYPSAQDLAQDPTEVILLCHSNTGAGALPDNLQPLYLHLIRDCPRLSDRRYGVINLGDSSYTTFNEGGRALDAAFADLGAHRIGVPLVLDASSGDDPASLVRTWLDHWATLL